VQRGENELALTLASEGRARLLAVALRMHTLDLPAGQRRRLDELRAAIRTEQSAADGLQATARAAALERLIDLRQELLGLVKSSGGGEGASGSALSRAQAVVAGGGAVVMPILTRFGSKVLVVTAAREAQALTVVDLPALTAGMLDLLVRGDASTGRSGSGKPGGWLGAYTINAMPPDELDRQWPRWIAAIGDIGTELWQRLGAPLDAALKERGVGPGARIVWMPSGALGILPLGMARDPASKRYLADDYEIAYAPSLEALTAAHSQVAHAAPATLAAVINPTGDLDGTEREGAVVASHFPAGSRTVLTREAATREGVLAALKGKSYWHVASHGAFSWDDARQSALVMHARIPLSVGTLMDTDGLGRPRLVVLSACETGLYDIERNPDEFVGLPGAFMALGAAGVVGTLWPVSDAATALLVAKFYDLHLRERLPPPTALRRAQLWLRQATDADLEGYARATAMQGGLESRYAAAIAEELSEARLRRSRNASITEWVAAEPADAGAKTSPRRGALARPYAHPYFWAGFVYTGL
jgi:CHAT domain-containing protein